MEGSPKIITTKTRYRSKKRSDTTPTQTSGMYAFEDDLSDNVGEPAPVGHPKSHGKKNATAERRIKKNDEYFDFILITWYVK